MDKNKIYYDLALIYAKAKFEHAISENLIPQIENTDEQDEINYLSDCFCTAIDLFAKSDDLILPDNIDF